ncbi:MAG: hypothetical protein IPP01_12130 [Saprospiraceae bacterium]|nr:hypothetical protein [Saprospiraceae bacterium]
MRPYIKYIIYSFLALCIISCRDPEIDVNTENPPPPPPPPTYFQKEVLGYVSDEEYSDLVGAQISLSNFQLQSDQLGFFYGDPLLQESRIIVMSTKSNYFPAYSLAIINDNKLPWIKLIQNKYGKFRTISGESGGEVLFDNGLVLKFESNSIIKSDSTLYSGQVKVYTKQYSTDNSSYSLPLNIEGKTKNNEIKYLQSLQGLSVELRGEANEKLGLIRDISIQLGVIGNAQNIKSTTTLWSLNLKTAFWEEVGTATLTGTALYSFKTKNIEAINIANGLEPIMLSGKILINGVASRSDMVITSKKDNEHIYAIKTNDLGYWKIAIPKDVEIHLDILGTCGFLLQKDLGSFSTSTELAPIEVLSNDLTSLSGIVYDCQNNPLKNGHVIVNIIDNGSQGNALSNKTVFDIDKNGFFKGNISICNSTQYLKITPFDRETGIEGKEFNTDKKGIIENIKLFACKNPKRPAIEIQYKNTIHYIDSASATVTTVLDRAQYTITVFEKLPSGNYSNYIFKIHQSVNSNNFELVEFKWLTPNGQPSPFFETIDCNTVLEKVLGKNKGDKLSFEIKSCKMSISGEKEIPGIITIETILE